MLNYEAIEAEIIRLTPDDSKDSGLDHLTEEFIRLAVSASVTNLNLDQSEHSISNCLELGASGEQIQEILTLISGLGVHTLMETALMLVRQLRKKGDEFIDAPLDPYRLGLWEKYVGTNAYWLKFEEEVPGFLNSILRLSPDTFEAFFIYCSIPWRSNYLPALTKELVSLAVDTSTTHRYWPGFKLHLNNAIKLGANRHMLLTTIQIAKSSTLHHGIGPK
jgi:alkylhydroperoxidase/carboxymuconolactone decarboxylase family protein YurZ